MTQTEAGTDRDAATEAGAVISRLRDSVAAGEHWFAAMMTAIRSWPLPEEQVGDRSFRYLVAGQAFDWLLLAERLATEIADFIPEVELDALLFNGELPIEPETADDALQELLGAKYKAHLNFTYGIRVEAALQLAVAEEVQKERHSTLVWDSNGRTDDEVHERIYGKPLADLLAAFRAESARSGEWLSLGDLSEWRYWLFQYRIKNCDPEKVASDTRKGLAALHRLEQAARTGREATPD